MHWPPSTPSVFSLSKVATSTVSANSFNLKTEVPQISFSNMYMWLEVVSGGGSGNKRLNSLPSCKVSHMWAFSFSFLGERLKEEKTKAGRREEGGGRVREVQDLCCVTFFYCRRKWYSVTFLSSLMCAFSSAVFCCRKTSSCWRYSATFIQELRDKLLLGKEKWQKHFSFGKAKHSTTQALCICVEAAKQLIKAMKYFDGSTLCVKYTLVGGVRREAPLPPKISEYRISES